MSIKDHSFLVESLYDINNIDLNLCSTKIIDWRCKKCNDIWSESTKSRKRYDYCDKCQKRNRNCGRCTHEGCNKYCNFNYPERPWTVVCGSHKLPRMVNVRSKRCEHENCMKQPQFNYPGETEGIRCSEHSLENMVNVKQKKCMVEDCYKKPAYNMPNETEGYMCYLHKTQGMILLTKNPKCKKEGCNKAPNFNYPGETKRLYCSKCREPGMINVNQKGRCHCGKSASYGYLNSIRETCASHAKPGMISLVGNKCEICNKVPYYKFPNKKPTRCTEHVLPGMIRNFTHLCNEESCDRQAAYNFPGELKPINCYLHKIPGMVNLLFKSCNAEGCYTSATFGYSGELPIKCKKHSLENMLGNPRAKCKHEKCYNFAICGTVSGKPLTCVEHILPHYKQLTSRKCVNCGDFDILDENLKCIMCNPNSFKDKNTHFKQNQVIEMLKASQHNNFVSVDKAIDVIKECGDNYRPDVYYNALTHCVILEIDEGMHKNYNDYCERVRMYNIAQGLGLPTIFIRYNPDRYKDKNGNYVDPTPMIRKEKLLEMISYCKTAIPKYNEEDEEEDGEENGEENEFIRVIYLFYDNYDHESSFKFEILDPLREIISIKNRENINSSSSSSSSSSSDIINNHPIITIIPREENIIKCNNGLIIKIVSK